MYDEFCYSMKCQHLREWDWQFDDECQPYPCVSCDLIGQSINIDEYPMTCPYIDEIKNFQGTQDKSKSLTMKNGSESELDGPDMDSGSS